MNFTLKSKSILCFLLSLTMVFTVFAYFPDYSYAKTNSASQEKAAVTKKTTPPKKGAKYDGFIVSIKDSKIDAVGDTDIAGEIPSTDSDKFYLIETTPEAIILASASAIEYVEPNYKRYLFDVPVPGVVTPDSFPPNDSDYTSLINWSGIGELAGPAKVYPTMGIDTLWKSGLRGSGVTVAVLDTGIMQHNDMVTPSRILVSPNTPGGSVVASSLNNDVEGHGTMTTSLIHATYNNGKNIAGIADQSTLISLRVFGNYGGEVYATTFQTINAYTYLLQPGNTPGVMSLSYGGPQPTTSEQSLLSQLVSAGCIVIAANGNDGANTDSTKNQLSYPAAYPSVIGVGATDGNGIITSYSSKNSSVDVSAWGDYVAVLDPEDPNETVADCGTSFAAPIVAGIAACLKGAFPNLTSAQFRTLIQYTSTDKGPIGWDSFYGWGLINAAEIYHILDYGLVTVAFNDRGNVDTRGYYVNQNLTGMPTPTRPGYTLLGWYTAASGGAKVSSSTVVTSNMTLYARWALSSYKISFNVNGGKSISTKSKTVTYTKAMGSLPTPSRKGYNFLGWKSGKSSGTSYSSSKIWNEVANRTLYANWTKSKVVQFNANGGSVASYGKAVKKGSKYGTLPTPTRAGHKFKGWYTKKSGGSKVTASKKVTSSKNFTIYAQWK